MVKIQNVLVFLLLVQAAQSRFLGQKQHETISTHYNSEKTEEQRSLISMKQKESNHDDVYKSDHMMSHLQNVRLKHIRSKLSVEALLGEMAWKAVEHRVNGCHFALLTLNADHPVVRHIISYSGQSVQPLEVIDVLKHRHFMTNSNVNELKGVSTTVCRVFLIDLMDNDENVDQMYSFLARNHLNVWPDAWVVVMGKDSKANDFLLHKVFRNTQRPVYLGLSDRLLAIVRSSVLNIEELDQEERYISVFSRCLYCDKGYPALKFLFQWQIGTDLKEPLNPFPDQFTDFQGRKFRTVSMPTFPFNSYTVNLKVNAPKIELHDCLDIRLLRALSSRLNFTFETYGPWTLQFGVKTESGNWTGLVGALQHNIADFSTIVAPTRERLKVIDTTNVYQSDVLSVVSLKPDLIPQYLVIIKPYTADVWLYLILSTMVMGFIFWLLQKIWSLYSGERGVTLSWAIFYSWAVFLDDPSLRPPKNTTARILGAFWLISCLITTTGFRSALVAHLGVQGKTKPVDSFKDLVEKKNFKWGIEAYYLTGLPLIYFQTTADPIVKEVYKHIEPLENNDVAFEKIIKGNYALVTFEIRAHTIINSFYKDNYGNTAYYVGKEGYSIVPYFGWGYGKGTPFRDLFGVLQARLNDAGIISHWTKDVVASRVRANRKEISTGDQSSKKVQLDRIPGEQAVRLRVIHLIGVFLVLLLGYIVSILVLLGERLVAQT